TFPCVYDGKREGDVEAEVETPGFEPGLRLYISVNKSKDTVGGQDIVGRKKMYINRYQRRLL
ncbi:MAG: hypothetical protein KKH85_08280, partial [Proteobacteria bacterium]|nr:hypothetical protein [Pseudomonadota bacterium]